ncbi:MAG: Transcriptional regulator, MarR family [uncultured Thermomicrobiales bacterium]|uniref:Transcriptional regulator, MarR family n=1 Tax=uncultured Thermomicrobiales bacterium TaxID=1645740 RepID=A0A6J4UVW4_9BACT|nr:MAG: Transcriptional regulator, MarR family [uncultured Thermomicrobiales bacterium]
MRTPRTPAGATITDLILATFRLNGRLIGAGDQLIRDLGLSSSRWQVLFAVLDRPLPAAGIARHMGLTRQSVQRTVDLLAAEGLVTFADNPYHQRARLVCPTERGRELLREVSCRQADWADRLAEGLDPDELRAAVHLMDTIRRRLETPAAEEEGHA